jgi:hypothetical protein
MPLTKDVIHEYFGYHTLGAVCRVRVYERPGAIPVIVATELPENQNTSITNMAEYLAAEIPARYLPGVLDSDQAPPFIWVEHYPAERRPYGSREEYDLVTFADYWPRQRLEAGRWRVKIGSPAWRRIPRAEVEQLIGEPLD